jgi:hypothetical protein
MADYAAGSYRSLVELIESVEGSSKSPDVEFVDISPVQEAKKRGEVQGSYVDAMETISRIESERGREPRRRAPTVQPHLAMSGVQQTATSQGIPAPQQVPAQPQLQPAQRPQEFAEPTIKVQAEKEAKQLVSEMHLQKVKINIRRINLKELVLPSLSMADQISELERIIEGIRENAFDQEHMTIVVEEVYGLQKYLAMQDKEQKRKRIEPSPLEQSLIALREQRLNDAFLELKQRGVV